jgi:hypothetical protein
MTPAQQHKTTAVIRLRARTGQSSRSIREAASLRLLVREWRIVWIIGFSPCAGNTSADVPGARYFQT